MGFCVVILHRSRTWEGLETERFPLACRPAGFCRGELTRGRKPFRESPDLVGTSEIPAGGTKQKRTHWVLFCLLSRELDFYDLLCYV
jgi:hypothetical protein